MIRLNKLYIAIVVILIVLAKPYSSFSQDPHFSQYFSSPLSLNPANTGFFDGDHRLAINQRQQWWNVGNTYSTTSISADFKIMSEHIPQFDTFGIGFSGIFDRSSAGALKSNYISASASYHKNLSDEGKQILGVGLQTTLANRYVDFTRLTFASQYNGGFFDTSIPVNFSSSATNTHYLDVNAGVLYAVHLEGFNGYLGVSLYHINKPSETLYDAQVYTVPLRKTIHFGAELNISDQSSLLLSGVYMNQKRVNDKLIGAAYSLKTINDYFNVDNIKLYVGLWYRLNESLIPYIGVDYNNWGVGLNYSTVAPTSSIYIYQPRTFELSLVYRYKSKFNQSLQCPRF